MRVRNLARQENFAQAISELPGGGASRRGSSFRPLPTLCLAAGLAVLALVDWRVTLGVGLVCVARDVQLRNTLQGVFARRGW